MKLHFPVLLPFDAILITAREHSVLITITEEISGVISYSLILSNETSVSFFLFHYVYKSV